MFVGSMFLRSVVLDPCTEAHHEGLSGAVLSISNTELARNKNKHPFSIISFIFLVLPLQKCNLVIGNTTLDLILDEE